MTTSPIFEGPASPQAFMAVYETLPRGDDGTSIQALLATMPGGLRRIMTDRCIQVISYHDDGPIAGAARRLLAPLLHSFGAFRLDEDERYADWADTALSGLIAALLGGHGTQLDGTPITVGFDMGDVVDLARDLLGRVEDPETRQQLADAIADYESEVQA